MGIAQIPLRDNAMAATRTLQDTFGQPISSNVTDLELVADRTYRAQEVLRFYAVGVTRPLRASFVLTRYTVTSQRVTAPFRGPGV